MHALTFSSAVPVCKTMAKRSMNTCRPANTTQHTPTTQSRDTTLTAETCPIHAATNYTYHAWSGDVFAQAHAVETSEVTASDATARSVSCASRVGLVGTLCDSAIIPLTLRSLPFQWQWRREASESWKKRDSEVGGRSAMSPMGCEWWRGGAVSLSSASRASADEEISCALQCTVVVDDYLYTTTHLDNPRIPVQVLCSVSITSRSRQRGRTSRLHRKGRMRG